MFGLCNKSNKCIPYEIRNVKYVTIMIYSLYAVVTQIVTTGKYVLTKSSERA